MVASSGYLSLSARNNIRVAQPTSSAQYFHLLRSQVLRERPTPLVVFTPKSMLRAIQTRSPLTEFEHGCFQTVLDDHVERSRAVSRVVLASGKIAHEAIAKRDATSANHVAVVRVEQLYPWPTPEIERILSRTRTSPRSSGSKRSQRTWARGPLCTYSMHHEFSGLKVSHVARAESASPATGSGLVHDAEQADLLARALR